MNTFKQELQGIRETEAAVCMTTRNWDADAIKNLRARVGLTQEEFAKKYEDISIAQIQSWERGVRSPGRLARRFLDGVAEMQARIENAYGKLPAGNGV